MIDLPILKTCKYHGNLYENDLIKKGKLKSGNQSYRCKKCMKEMHHKNYEMNKLKIKEKTQQYRSKNKEKVKEWKVDYYHKYKERDKEKKRKRDKKYYDKGKDQLNDRYIKHLIQKRTPLKYKDIPEELIKLKRTILLTKKQIKESI